VRSSFAVPLTDRSIAYSWHQIIRRVGVSDNNLRDTNLDVLDIPVHYGKTEEAHFDRPGIVVTRCSDTAWPNLLGLASDSLDWLPTHKAVVPDPHLLPFDDPIPVLFWGEDYEDGHAPFAKQLPDGTLVFHVDIIAATLFMLSRWEETVVALCDEHGRFPSTASVAYRQGFLDRPVVDEYALILREWLRLLLPHWEPKRRSFTVKLSHDIDHIHRFLNWLAPLRTLGGDLLKRRDPISAWQTSVDAITQAMAPQRSSYFQGIYSLAQISKANDLGNDAFYFMAVDPNSPDSSYDPASSLVRECIQDLGEQGFEIGFHAGYDTLNDPTRLAEEKARLDAVLGHTRYGGRQHHLRFQVPNTWRDWEQTGLVYDATMGYADCEGFRCGTCHAFRPFDLEKDRELDVWEQPLIVMDQTLKRYRRLSPEQGEAQILKLAQRCKQVGGTFTLLWHNSSLSHEWHRWRGIYQRVVATLAQMQSAASM
jgi:hypothetical protein